MIVYLLSSKTQRYYVDTRLSRLDRQQRKREVGMGETKNRDIVFLEERFWDQYCFDKLPSSTTVDIQNGKKRYCHTGKTEEVKSCQSFISHPSAVLTSTKHKQTWWP